MTDEKWTQILKAWHRYGRADAWSMIAQGRGGGLNFRIELEPPEATAYPAEPYVSEAEFVTARFDFEHRHFTIDGRILP